MMSDREVERYVSCPVCGRVIMKCQGTCKIEVTCPKCSSEIIASMDKEKLMIWENRKEIQGGRAGQVSVSVSKGKKPITDKNIKKAACY